jgi:hypothetical protein
MTLKSCGFILGPGFHQSLRRALVVFFSAAALLAAGTDSEAANRISARNTGLSITVDSKVGTYEIHSRTPAWTFSGTLQVPLEDVAAAERSRDAAGDYQEISFKWSQSSAPMHGSIRLYESKPLALFSQTCDVATDLPPAPFPAFTKIPGGLHIFSYGHHEFAPPRFDTNEISTPWLLFDDQANAFVISPATHFMVASMLGDGRTEVASGFNPNLRHLPAGFTQQTLVAIGSGINKTWDAWGRALVALQGVTRPSYDADTTLKYLGYWTDNGAGYYYNYDLQKGYAGTLQELVQCYRQEQIPIRYLQLDSWWYYKTITGADGEPGKSKKSDKLPEGEWNRYGGLLEYKAHTDLFPNGLDAFQKSIGLPLITHNRWIDPASPYNQHYKISGIAAVDPKWWDDIASYLKSSGIITYEQDWLDRIFTYSPAFTSDLGTGEAFLDNMSRACNERGITMQYCMPYPCYFLQGSRYPNLTTIRTSGDRFNTNRWNDFLYTSRLASSLGIWPWTDVYMSTERGNVLLSTLSAGPVGIGDLIGSETKTNLLQAVRADGVIVKPDAPIVPLDRTYVADAKNEPAPLTAATYTDRDGIRTEYVFAFNRGATPSDNVNFNISELGLDRPAYVYDYFAESAKRLGPGADFSVRLGKKASAFYVVAPIGKSGIAFLGDKNKFVGMGKQRIRSVQDESGKLTVGLLLAAGEKSVVLHGYAATAPKATVLAGVDDALQYDPSTGHFTIEVKSEDATPIETSSGDPVRRLTVVFETHAK